MSVGNTKYGDGALQKNINGSNNSAFGICSSRDTDASWNTSFGAYANMSNTVGISNVAVGTNSLLLDISGSYNTAIGTATLLNNLANSNTAIGSNSMENNIIGKENVAIGVQSGYENIDGSKNIFIGAYAGFNNSNGSNNIFLGADTNIANTSKTYNNSTAIGYGSIIDSSNQIMLGTTEENVIIPGNAYSTNILPNYTEQSLVTKKYVDTYISGGVQITIPCNCATVDDISLSGINVPSAIDNYPLSNGMRVLVRCQDSSNNVSIPNINNGIYDYYNYGLSAELIRASDCSGNNVKGQATFIKDGNLNKSYIFVQTNYDSFTNEAIAGIYPLSYQEFYKVSFSIGNGLEIINDTLQVKSNLTNTAGDPYLTDIGILGTLSVGGDVSLNSNVDISKKLKVGNDASFNSKIDVSGTLSVLNTDAYVNNIRIGRGKNNLNTNTVVGTNSGSSITDGSFNTFIGYESGKFDTSGSYNTFVGYESGKYDSSGSNNTFVGHWSGLNVKNDSNVAIGAFTLSGSNNTGANNTVIGLFSGTNLSNGRDNVFLGKSSGQSMIDGCFNAFIGTGSGFKSTKGQRNACLGNDSGSNIQGNFNVLIGASTDASGNIDDSVAIGYNVKVDTSNTIIIGKSSQNSQIPGKLKVSSDASFNSFLDASSLIVRNDASFNSKMRVNGDASFNSFLDASSLIVRNNVSFSNPVNMNSSEIYNCSAIRSTNNQNITIEATVSGDIILKNNNIDAITISDTPEIIIKYPVSFESNTASNREMQLSSINFSDSVGGYSISTRAKIFNDGSYLNIVNFNQPGFTEFKIKDPLGNILIPIAIDYLGVSLSGNSKILGKLNVSNDASFNSNLDVLGNSKISGKLFVNGDSSFNGIIQQTDTSVQNGNIFKYSTISNNISLSGSADPTLTVIDKNTGNAFYFLPNSGPGNWNSLASQNGISMIARGGSYDKTNFSLATYSSQKHGLKMTVDSSSQIKTELWCGDNQSIIMDNSLGYISMNGKLKVGNDASFNSKIDVSGTLSVLNTDAYVNNIRIGKGNNNLNTNTVVGTNSGSSITDGSFNTFVGYESGKYDSSGSLNTFVGHYSGLYVKRDQNVAVGAYSLSNSNNTGINNTTVGYFSGGALTNGRDNVFLGKSSGQNMADGSWNTFIGSGSGYNNVSGKNNSYLGSNSGFFSKGSNNILIGFGTDASGNIDNSIAIGYDVKVDTSNTIIIGTSSQNSQIPGKLKVFGDASFNSNVDILGNLNMVGNNFISCSTNKTTSLLNNVNSLGGFKLIFNTLHEKTIPIGDQSYNLQTIDLNTFGFVSNATYLMTGQYYIRNVAGFSQSFFHAGFDLSNNAYVTQFPLGQTPSKYKIALQKNTISSGNYDSIQAPFSFIIDSNDFTSSMTMTLYFLISVENANNTWKVGFVNTYITRLG
jgi:hypothetical protein